MEGGGGRPCWLRIVSWRRWCVTWRGKKRSPRRRTRGVGVAEDLWLECVYRTRPAPTHLWPQSQFPGWGPDLGDVPPLSWGFCHSHYHLTPWGVLHRMELKFGSPKQAVHDIPNQPVHAEKQMASDGHSSVANWCKFHTFMIFCHFSIGFRPPLRCVISLSHISNAPPLLLGCLLGWIFQLLSPTFSPQRGRAVGGLISGVPQGSLLTLRVIEIITHAAWSTRSDYNVWVANSTFPCMQLQTR